MFSVCSTIYGEYPDLAKRLLKSIRHFEYVKDIRLGLNAPSEETREFVHSWAQQTAKKCRVLIFEDTELSNLGKYPLMRQLFRYRPLAPFIMWFDDDSYLDVAVNNAWWERAAHELKSVAQIGSLHKIMQRGKQFELIKQQPWYADKVVNHRHRFLFATGGWWAAKSKVILDWDYPFIELYHNGGDSILGELLRQQGKKLQQFSPVQCHCESCVRKGIKTNVPVVHINVGGRKGRRGIGVNDEKYVWADGNLSPDLSHQDFSLRVFTYGP